MNLKQRAMLRTAGMFGICLLGASIVFGLTQLLTTQSAIVLFCFAVLAFVVYQIYKINLGQLEYEDKWGKKVDTQSKE